MANSHIIFRKASYLDTTNIVTINNSYFIESDIIDTSHGFIITNEEINQVTDYIINNPNSYYIAQTLDRELIGFVKISDSAGDNIIQSLEWLNPHLKTIFERENTLYIEKVVVKRSFQFKHIGTFIYKSLFYNYPEIFFYSFIVKKPLVNTLSLYFHRKLNFMESAIFRSLDFYGFKDYESVLMLRIINSNESDY